MKNLQNPSKRREKKGKDPRRHKKTQTNAESEYGSKSSRQ